MSCVVDTSIQVLTVAADSVASIAGSVHRGDTDEQFTVEAVAGIEGALAALDSGRPDCVVTSYSVASGDLSALIEAIRERYPKLPVVVDIDDRCEAVANEVLAAGATDCIRSSGGETTERVVCTRITNAVAADRVRSDSAGSEETIDRFFAESPLGAVRFDGSFRIDRLNEQAEAMLGYTEEELQGEPWDMIVAERHQQRVAGIIGDRRAADDTVRVRTEIVHKDDTVNTYRWDCQAITDAAGNRHAIFATFDEAIDTIESQVVTETDESLIGSLSDGVYILDDVRQFTFVNQEFVELVGYEREEVVGNTASLIKNEDSLSRSKQAIERILSDDGSKTATFEVSLQRADGEAIHCQNHICALQNRRDEPVGIIGTLQNVTEHRQQEQRFQTLIEETNEIISIIDAEGRFQYQSKSVERILGYSPEEVIGESLWEYIHPDDKARVKAVFNRWVSTGQPAPEPVEYRTRHADGSWRWMEASGKVHAKALGCEGYITNSREITARKERQQQLELFDRVIRHNLRNDMNVIRGAADLLQSKETGEGVHRASQIKKKCNELLATVKKQRDIAQLLRQSPTQSVINVQAALDTICSELRSAHPDAKVAISCENKTRLRADDKFVYALEELITNGIIHNDSDTPTVEMAVTESREQVRITVTDNGPQIPEMERRVIANPENRSPLYHGSGLGLWLVKLIISRSGGTVQFVETEQEGNTIALSVPQPAA
jgi:PAS domain S-box-containing protein